MFFLESGNKGMANFWEHLEKLQNYLYLPPHPFWNWVNE